MSFLDVTAAYRFNVRFKVEDWAARFIKERIHRTLNFERRRSLAPTSSLATQPGRSYFAQESSGLGLTEDEVSIDNIVTGLLVLPAKTSCIQRLLLELL